MCTYWTDVKLLNRLLSLLQGAVAHSWVHCQRSYSWVGRISGLIIPTYLQNFSICDWYGKGPSQEPQQTNKQTNKQKKQNNKQTNKQASKQANKQTNKQTYIYSFRSHGRGLSREPYRPYRNYVFFLGGGPILFPRHGRGLSREPYSD